MDMSEAAFDNIGMLFKSTEDDNDFLINPIDNFKHIFIDYLIKTGWNGWLIVTKYMPGVIRMSILNEVIDYCKYLDCVSKFDGDSAGENLKSFPMWFNKLHDDTIFLLIMEVKSFCYKGLKRGIELSFESNMTKNTLSILATKRSVYDFKSTLIEYESSEAFPKDISDHQSILDTLLSSYVAYQDNIKQDFKDSERPYPNFCTRKRLLLHVTQHLFGISGFKPSCKIGKSMEVANQEKDNCLDILRRCVEENEKAIMVRRIQEMMTSFGMITSSRQPIRITHWRKKEGTTTYVYENGGGGGGGDDGDDGDEEEE